MSPQNSHVGPLSALALLAAILIGAFSFATAPFLWLMPLHEEITVNQELLSALEARLARHSVAGGRRVEPARLMLEGETADIAGARLQKLTNDRVAEAGGHASSFQLSMSQHNGEMTRLSLNLSINIGIDGLRDLLHGIETGSPLIFIDDIAIRVPASAAQQAEPYFLGPFDISLQVSGFFAAGGWR